MVKLGIFLRKATQRLKSHSETAELEARLVATYFLGQSSAWILVHMDEQLTEEQCLKMDAALERLENGEPLAYILGEREFYGQPFEVNPSVLVPRPETEHLVEYAIGWLNAHPMQRKAIDVGCGSGCIGISLALNIPDLYITFVDISESALDIAKKNALRHAILKRSVFLKNNLLYGIDERFDLICANLPYIPSQDVPATHEPQLALDGGGDGLCLIQRLLTSAEKYLIPNGLILLEIETRQGKAVMDLGRQYFRQAEIQLQKDLAGHDRLVIIALSEKH